MLKNSPIRNIMKKVKTPQISIYAQGLDHPEGLAIDHHGVIWCGGEEGQVYRISKQGKKIETVAQVGGFNLGFAFSPAGDLYFCNHKVPAIFKLNPLTLKTEIFCDQILGKKVRTPNHLVFDRKGILYVSDSGEWGKKNGAIYRINSQGKGEIWMKNLSYPNGVALDREDKALYVVQTFLNNTLRIPIQSHGEAGKSSLYAQNLKEAPDGLVFDRRGNLYICCYGNSRIYRITPQRKKEVFAQDPIGLTLNRPTNLIYREKPQEALLAANLGGYHLSSILITKENK